MSMAKSTEDDRDDDSVSFDPEDVRIRLDSVPERYRDYAVALIRNPDASVGQIADYLGVVRGVVEKSLFAIKLASDGKTPESGPSTTWHEQRGSSGGKQALATSFDELTDQQQAIVDYCARLEPDEYEKKAKTAIGQAVNASDRYDVLISTSYPSHVLKKYEWLVHERRKSLRQRGELESNDPDIDFPVYVPRNGHPMIDVRASLEQCDVALPDDNLDGLAEAGATDPDRNDSEFTKANDMKSDIDPEDAAIDYHDLDDLPTDFDPHDGIVSDSHPHRVYVGDVQKLPDDADDDDVQFGITYWSAINNIEHYGVFVSLNMWDKHSKDDVSALLPVENMERSIAGSEVGDVVPVQLAERTKRGMTVLEVPVSFDDADALDDADVPAEPTLDPDADSGEATVAFGDVVPPEQFDELLANAESSDEEIDEAVDEILADIDDLPDDIEDEAQALLDEMESDEPAESGATDSEPDDHMENEIKDGDDMTAVADKLDARLDELTDEIDDVHDRIDSLVDPVRNVSEQTDKNADAITALREDFEAFDENAPDAPETLDFGDDPDSVVFDAFMSNPGYTRADSDVTFKEGSVTVSFTFTKDDDN